MTSAPAKPVSRMTEPEQIKRIHILKNKLGLDDMTYREMLWGMFSVHSSKDMNFGQRGKLIARLTQEIRNSYANKNAASENQIKLIVYLGKKYCSNLLGFCSKVLKKDVAYLNNLTKSDGIKVIDALKRYEQR